MGKEHQKAYTCILKDWEEFYDVAQAFHGKSWVYRGQEKSSWGLYTSLERDRYDNNVNGPDYDDVKRKYVKSILPFSTYTRDVSGRMEYADELSAIKDFARLAKKNFSYHQDDFVNWLAVMQHFGAKTRLLDFSYSLFVALFFAFARRAANGNRAIWCVNLDPIHQYAQEQIVRFAGSFTAEDGDGYLPIANAILATGKELALNVHGVIPLRLTGNNERYDAQSGMFLFPVTQGKFKVELAASLGIEEGYVKQQPQIDCDSLLKLIKTDDTCLIKLEFEHAMQRNAWNVLDQANITARSLFPGLEGIARSVRYDFN